MSNIKLAEEIIGYKFKDIKYLERALIHSSFANRHGLRSYDRLEFLGDSIIDFLVAEKLTAMYPDMTEGRLTTFRSELVAAAPMSEIAQQIGIDKCIVSISPLSEKMRCDVIESITAAIYLDSKDMDECRKFAERIFKKAFDNAISEIVDYKSVILEKYCKNKVEFKMIDKQGPDHNPVYTVGLYIDGQLVVTAQEGNIKKAEQLCAKSIYNN